MASRSRSAPDRSGQPSTLTTESLSTQLRKEGNVIYKSTDQGVCPSVERERLVKAANLYLRAFDAGERQDEKIPASKNMALTQWKLANVNIVLGNRTQLAVHFFKEAFKYFSYAHNHGKLTCSEEWTQQVCLCVDRCWVDFSTFMDGALTLEQRIDEYYDVLQMVQIDQIRGKFYLNLARFHFRSGVTAIQNGQFQRGLSEMKNCGMPIHEARTHCQGDKNVPEECVTLEEDAQMHMYTAEAMQAISIGDNLFKQTTQDAENINMDIIWDIIDWYKLAVLRTRERTEMEQEAIACSRLGRIYDRILKMTDKCKEYMMASIQLAHSMQPRTFNSEEWFKDASEIVKRYQDQKKAEEDAKWAKERDEIIKGMSTELEELKKADAKEDLELLDHVYKHHPPKNPLYMDFFSLSMAKDVDMSKKKKLFYQGVVNYHPDRADVETNGKKWKIITEEITKMLTKRYNRIKCVD